MVVDVFSLAVLVLEQVSVFLGLVHFEFLGFVLSIDHKHRSDITAIETKATITMTIKTTCWYQQWFMVAATHIILSFIFLCARLGGPSRC